MKQSNMVKVSGFFNNVSILILTLILLIVYAFLGDRVGIWYDDQGISIYTISRNMFFYYCFGLSIVYNLLFYLFKKFYFKKSGIKDPGQQEVGYKNALITWWNFIIISINFFFLCFLIFTGLANNAQDYKFSSVTLIPIIGIVPLMLAIFSLPAVYFYIIRNFKKKLI